jgi:hypothetical protein
MQHKMTDIEVDPFGDHGIIDHPDETDETFPLIPIGGGIDNTIDTNIHETDFGGTGLGTRVLRDQVEALYQRLYESFPQNPEVIHTDLFEIRDGELYSKTNSKPTTDKQWDVEIQRCYR